jgi:hypothetical protein
MSNSSTVYVAVMMLILRQQEESSAYDWDAQSYQSIVDELPALEL